MVDGDICVDRVAGISIKSSVATITPTTANIHQPQHIAAGTASSR
jgi:hypothetical protein